MNLKTNLYEHQQAAVDKLLPIKIGALYAEMGTGKTRMALEIIARRHKAGRIDKVLWFCPCSIKTGIRRDIEYHASGTEELIAIYGLESISQSSRIYYEILQIIENHNVFLVVDESSMVKNHHAIRTQRIMAIAELCRYRMILSGTPISKSEADLYAQWYILDKRIFGYNSFWSFAANHLEYDKYGRIRRTLNVDYLTDKIASYTFSIKKDECIDLPEKEYEMQYFRLTWDQVDHYDEIKWKMLEKVDEFKPETIYRLFTALQLITSGRRVTKCDPKLISRPFFDSPLENPRIEMFLELINGLADEKVIVWCKYHHEINEVRYALQSERPDIQVAEFHGKLPLKWRNTQLDNFQDSAQILIANKSCGGYGLNLQYCHNMIYYSNDFDYAMRAQSEDRVHRIGQTQKVLIQDIIANCKVDERIMSSLWRKENLADAFKYELKSRRNISTWIDGDRREDAGVDKNRAKRKREKKGIEEVSSGA